MAVAVALLTGSVLANTNNINVNVSIIIILGSGVLFVVEYLRNQ